ncbi:restriction endonuclease subunit S [Campylobacter magnus]|uniref:restriction endonuclease subunit S n=1 Tax=Campylobacter magnus TaxID=3026462 RepID=UPI00235FA415|nr:restriction endonuclease subunit S [Campylobacter magnus]MDD0855388.1 restriction endonuclease subunit S [Campylobacter magnus]
MRILEFIKQNCKNVEFKPLYELTIWDKKFKGIPKEWQEKTIKFNHILSADLKNLLCDDGDIFLLSTGNFSGYTNSEICKNFNQAEIIALPSGGFANIKYFNGKFIDSGNLLAISKDTSKVNLKFIFYYLQSNLKIIEKMFRGAGIKHPEMSSILSIKIPVPSLEVQNKIVEVLDSFSSLVRSLVRSLVLEKTAREKQYKYYLNHLITNARNSRIFKLGEVCEFVRGIRVTKKDLNNGKYLVYQNSLKPLGNYDKANCSANSTFIIVGGSAGSIGYSYDDFWAADDCFYCKTNENVINRFIYYILINKQNELLSKVRKASVPRISRNDIENIEIPLPPLDEQERIVRILDSLNELANGLSAGIPKEIELRQKQYEYWRDRLLEFPSKDSK